MGNTNLDNITQMEKPKIGKGILFLLVSNSIGVILSIVIFFITEYISSGHKKFESVFQVLMIVFSYMSVLGIAVGFFEFKKPYRGYLLVISTLILLFIILTGLSTAGQDGGL